MAPRSSSYSPGSSIAPVMETVTRSIGTTTRSFIHRGADAAWTGSRAGSKPLWVAEQVLAACQGIEAPVIACLGLAYKADVGGLRESPESGDRRDRAVAETCPGRLLVVEPHVDDLPPGLAAGGRTALVSLDQALAADVILLLTDHEEFRRVDRTYLAGKRVIDTRGIWRDNPPHRSDAKSCPRIKPLHLRLCACEPTIARINAV